MENLNNEVLKGALANEICQPSADRIKTASLEELLQMYLEGIDFCLSNNFPSNDFLKAKGGELLAGYGIRIDEVFEVCNPDKLVLLGVCSTKAIVNEYAVSQIFVKHQSKAEIAVSDNAFLVIDAFDDTVLNVVASGNCKVLVNIYGRAKLSHNQSDNAIIKVVHKLKETY